jgi:hypothetical protein
MRTGVAVLLIIVLCLGSFTGCRKNRDKIESDFAVMSSASATPEHIRSMAEFLDDNIASVKTEAADRMVSDYEKYLHRYITETREQIGLEALRPYFDPDTKRIDHEKIKCGDMRDYYENLSEGPILAVLYEDTPVLLVDYKKLLEKYGDYISEPLKQLYDAYAVSTEKPMAENATLAITYKELLGRADRIEKLLREFSDNELIKKDALWLYGTYINAMLMGTTNSPIFNRDNDNTFSGEAKNVYMDYMRANADAVLTYVLKEYFSYLLSIDFKLDFNDKVMSKVFFDTCNYLVTEAEKRVLE